eukprot:m.171117 g.171117  ORF g.171117 m.171117 type:complete len:77 (-) comp18277_c0_seq17:2467-2697(-)
MIRPLSIEFNLDSITRTQIKTTDKVKMYECISLITNADSICPLQIPERNLPLFRLHPTAQISSFEKSVRHCTNQPH